MGQRKIYCYFFGSYNFSIAPPKEKEHKAKKEKMPLQLQPNPLVHTLEQLYFFSQPTRSAISFELPQPWLILGFFAQSIENLTQFGSLYIYLSQHSLSFIGCFLTSHCKFSHSIFLQETLICLSFYCFESCIALGLLCFIHLVFLFSIMD